MCTILIARRAHPRFPLILAANRDEFRARASSPPHLLDASVPILGGQDRVAGGTWLGVARDHFVAAVTNYRTHRASDPTRASRGALVLELLRDGDRERAEQRIRALGVSAYNPANLLFGDAQALFIACLRDEAPARLLEVPAGLSVLTNGEPEDRRGFPKIDRLIGLVARLPVEPDALVRHLHRALADHRTPDRVELPPPPEGSPLSPELLTSLDAICVHASLPPALAYGTVSSSILLFDERGALLRWDYADGSPCTHPLVRVR